MKDAQRTAADAAHRLCLESSIIAVFRLSSARYRHADEKVWRYRGALGTDNNGTAPAAGS
jgi:hypothetical protein